MRLFGRKGGGGSGGSALAEPALERFSGTDEDLAAEIERLSAAERRTPDLDVERTLLRLRNEAGIRRLSGATDHASFPRPDGVRLPDGGGLPAFSPTDLTPELMRAAILRDGCLLVRGLVPRDEALEFARLIDRSFTERERHDSGQPHDPALYEEFVPDPRAGEPLTTREWIKQGGGVLGVDGPAVNFRLMETFRTAGLPALVGAYLGEPPLITVQKTTLRRAEPAVPGGWHQDGKFMGPVRALNLWLSLSRCGDIAPGLDIVPRRIDRLVAAQTDEAVLDYVISQRMAEEAAGDTPIVRPIFEAGDALFFQRRNCGIAFHALMCSDC